MRWLFGCILAVVLAVSIPIRPAQADEGWIINSFHSDITIAPDASIIVQEDIRVDFGAQQKHGIFRTIPLRYHYDDTRDRYYTLEVRSVTNGSTALMHSDSVDNDNEVIKIGDPNVLVSGAQRYVITYAVAGVLNSFPDHDELYWNVDGALWPVPKQSVTATVHLPSPVFQNAACYQGPPGSTETCSSEGTSTTANYSSTRPLSSGEEMSVVTALSKSDLVVPPPMLEARARQFPQDAFDINPVTIGISLLLLVAGLAFIAWNWWAHGRDRAYLTQYYLTNDPRQHTLPLFSHQPVAVEFEPPNKMRPAELGLILDETADPKDLTATIVDLAVRGHLTISEVPKWDDWLFTWKAGSGDHLLPYEQTILDGMFTGRHEVKLSELRFTFRPTLSAAEAQMYADSVKSGLFTHSPRQARAAWGCVGIAVVITGAALTVGLGLGLGWGLVGAAVVITGLVLTATFPFMPQRTAAGRELMQHTLGFRLYMTTAEKYRQQFAANSGIFTQLLPYAIVFGCVALWAKAFEGIDTTTSNSWYVGTRPFTSSVIVGGLEAMNSGISRAITYTPPSTGSGSGFGGGGFSGGGGGGGGGGSW
jgi:uncharacterized membrane protein YgcG